MFNDKQTQFSPPYMEEAGLSGTARLMATTLCVGVFALGCGRTTTDEAELSSTLPALAALGAKPGAAVVAQGQLEPAKGINSIVGPPGDEVESIDVVEGQQVKAGQTLGRLVGQAAKELELEIAMARRDEAKAKMKADEAAATAKLDVAKVGLQQSKLQLEQASGNLAESEANGGRLGLLAQELTIADAKLKQLKAASSDRDTGRLVTASSIEQQQLSVDQSRSQLAAARREALQKIDGFKLAIEGAEKEIIANQLAIAAAKSASGITTMDKQIELLRLQIRSTKLISPVDATVLTIDTPTGEPTTNIPVLRLADTRRMIARAEINVVDLQRVAIGANATITSAALPKPLRGKVKSISQLIGSPRLPTLNPMARVDWRSAQVIIEIDDASNAEAAQRIHLQVDIAIEAPLPSLSKADEPSV